MFCFAARPPAGPARETGAQPESNTALGKREVP